MFKLRASSQKLWKKLEVEHLVEDWDNNFPRLKKYSIVRGGVVLEIYVTF